VSFNRGLWKESHDAIQLRLFGRRQGSSCPVWEDNDVRVGAFPEESKQPGSDWIDTDRVIWPIACYYSSRVDHFVPLPNPMQVVADPCSSHGQQRHHHEHRPQREAEPAASGWGCHLVAAATVCRANVNGKKTMYYGRADWDGCSRNGKSTTITRPLESALTA
jgi:hypothetical protein